MSDLRQLVATMPSRWAKNTVVTVLSTGFLEARGQGSSFNHYVVPDPSWQGDGSMVACMVEACRSQSGTPLSFRAFKLLVGLGDRKQVIWTATTSPVGFIFGTGSPGVTHKKWSVKQKPSMMMWLLIFTTTDQLCLSVNITLSASDVLLFVFCVSLSALTVFVGSNCDIQEGMCYCF